MSAATITVRVPLAIRKRGGRKLVVLPDGALARTAAPVVSTRADPALIKALARAFRWQKLLDEGRYASITEIAAAEKIERGFLGKMLQLTLLAPGIVEAILDGRAPPAVTLAALLGPFPLGWAGQRQAIEPRSASAAFSRDRPPEADSTRSQSILRRQLASDDTSNRRLNRSRSSPAGARRPPQPRSSA